MGPTLVPLGEIVWVVETAVYSADWLDGGRVPTDVVKTAVATD